MSYKDKQICSVASAVENLSDIATEKKPVKISHFGINCVEVTRCSCHAADLVNWWLKILIENSKVNR